MPEIRTDPVSGHRVILAPERARRPDEFGMAATGPCVFCPGREAETPPELQRLAGPEGWRARVVPNKYPALDAPSGGAHEVVVESSRHVSSFAALAEAEVVDVLGLWRDRLRALRSSGRYACGIVFKNEGAAAGASLEHVHSQVLALPAAPPGDVAEGGACALCADRDPARRVLERGPYEARVPFAPRFSHEVRIVPRAHAPRFEEAEDLPVLAGLLREVLGRIAGLLGAPAYNLVVHTAPFRGGDAFHWRIDLLPRTARPGGFEWGTGMFINTALPEQAAQGLREARA